MFEASAVRGRLADHRPKDETGDERTDATVPGAPPSLGPAPCRVDRKGQSVQGVQEYRRERPVPEPQRAPIRNLDDPAQVRQRRELIPGAEIQHPRLRRRYVAAAMAGGRPVRRRTRALEDRTPGVLPS